jgi:hypothetical protein
MFPPYGKVKAGQTIKPPRRLQTLLPFEAEKRLIISLLKAREKEVSVILSELMSEHQRKVLTILQTGTKLKYTHVE